jgi:hypothetical protein
MKQSLLIQARKLLGDLTHVFNYLEGAIGENQGKAEVAQVCQDLAAHIKSIELLPDLDC